MPVSLLHRAFALVLVPALLATGCARDAPAHRTLWTGDAEWTRWQDGWARAVRLDGERAVEVAAGVDRFRALAGPAGSETATLTLDAGGDAQTLTIDGPTAIDVPVRPGASLVLRASGDVALLHPRLVDGRLRGKRILLIVADTLRFDHVTPERMPEVVDYFAGGVRFTRAYSPASWTLPSMASILTGRLPASLRAQDGTLISLPAGTPTIASTFSERGYATAAVTANYTLHHENGFSQGYDLFLVPEPEAGFADARWIAERALAAHEAFADLDLFLHLQLMDPHDPYRDHETGDALAAPLAGTRLTDAELTALRRAYASEARYLSRELGRLLEKLGPVERAVFTADHGEELGEDGGFRHGPTLSDAAVRVPLLARGAGIERETIATPTPLAALKDLVVDGDLEPLRRAGAATMETFSFGPPRWAAVDETRRALLFARPLVERDAPHPVARWLAAHHPRMRFSPLESETPIPAAEIAQDRRYVDATLRRLVDQFAGQRRGLYVLARAGARAELRIAGARRDGIVWGDGERVAVRPAGDAAGGDALEIAIEAPVPFALVFLPTSGDAIPEVSGGELHRETAAPPRWRGEGLQAWLDPGPPPETERELEETLRRLEALGYL